MRFTKVMLVFMNPWRSSFASPCLSWGSLIYPFLFILYSWRLVSPLMRSGEVMWLCRNSGCRVSCLRFVWISIFKIFLVDFIPRVTRHSVYLFSYMLFFCFLEGHVRFRNILMFFFSIMFGILFLLSDLSYSHLSILILSTQCLLCHTAFYKGSL